MLVIYFLVRCLTLTFVSQQLQEISTKNLVNNIRYDSAYGINKNARFFSSEALLSELNNRKSS